ncbi:penicillin amidase [Robiginitalea myxolifaciens]|uniref:Penicillin amidase n=1 Tax=Robiginitalea myxolifaciens TaxID=400055 RepID=A0A1I6H0C4_9FLAO|nr:penicillin acylase family protein [Robiginitalea myxolifaciens]SFR47885.1 penicillin amidase [Robiginitalea myxolifaciens]
MASIGQANGDDSIGKAVSLGDTTIELLKTIRRIFKVLLALLLLLVLAGYFFVQHLKPEYDGELEMQGLAASVTVSYDTYGIPHITADSEPDAYRALGYVHAQDRLWQMELLRRIAPGRLSEVFGSQTLDADRLFLTLGIDEASRRHLAKADTLSREYQLSTAYLEGVNTFIAEGPTPLEYYLTGLDKEPFELVDIYNSLGYMAFSFAMAHKTDPLLEDIKNRLGPDYVYSLLEDCSNCTETIPITNPGDSAAATDLQAKLVLPQPRDEVASLTGVSRKIDQIIGGLPLPALEGSNSWVLSPAKTSTGAVLFANDPHIGFAQPSVWFEAHVKSPQYERYGYHLAGIPFPILAHNRQNAYGMTMFENDDIDFFYETVNPEDPSQYSRNGQWESFKEEKRMIEVKGEDAVAFSFRTSDLGPVVNDLFPDLKEETPVVMSWVFTSGKNEVLQALYGISHAGDFQAFEQAVSKIHAPGLNMMYGDAEGNVAWWAAAKLYRFPDSISTKLVMEASLDSLRSDVPFSENPRAINPEAGYVYSANNQPESTSAGYIPGYYLPENRARRITDLLECRDDWDREGVAEMIVDVTSSVDPEIISDLARAVPVDALNETELEFLDMLNSWDGSHALKSPEPVLYHRWVYELSRAVFQDELGEEGFKALLSTHIYKRVLARLVKEREWPWWDNVQTESVETAEAIIEQSFKDALEQVIDQSGEDPDKWEWKNFHTIEFEHPLGAVAALRPIFNIGPYPIHGSREVVNNLAFPYDSTGYFKVNAGPSTRRVIDFSDIENSQSILPTGQSGNPFSPHYDDQSELYIRGEFRKMLMNPAEIQEKEINRLVLTPVRTSE